MPLRGTNSRLSSSTHFRETMVSRMVVRSMEDLSSLTVNRVKHRAGADSLTVNRAKHRAGADSLTVNRAKHPAGADSLTVNRAKHLAGADSLTVNRALGAENSSRTEVSSLTDPHLSDPQGKTRNRHRVRRRTKSVLQAGTGRQKSNTSANSCNSAAIMKNTRGQKHTRYSVFSAQLSFWCW